MNLPIISLLLRELGVSILALGTKCRAAEWQFDDGIDENYFLKNAPHPLCYWETAGPITHAHACTERLQ